MGPLSCGTPFLPIKIKQPVSKRVEKLRNQKDENVPDESSNAGIANTPGLNAQTAKFAAAAVVDKLAASFFERFQTLSTPMEVRAVVTFENATIQIQRCCAGLP